MAPPADTQSATSTRSILIVDDDEDAHFFLKRMLRQMGTKVPVASVFDGEEAISVFERCLAGAESAPVAVFLDVKMPGKTGFEVLEWAKASDFLRRTTIAMVSASENPDDVARAMTLGARAYWGKPPESQRLKDFVEAALRAGV